MPTRPWPHAALRDEFLLRPDVTFLNHGSFGACPRPVFAAYQRRQRELEAQPVLWLGRRLPELLAAARAELAAYLGADPLDLVFVPNATYGVNAVARSLRLGPGDEVLASDHEYGACDRAWRFVCERRGAHYRQAAVPLPLRDSAEVVEAIWAAVTPRTRVLFLSHITSPTALILPVAELCRRAREAGIISVVDGAHAPGQIPLDMAAIGADFYVGNCHKWLCGPKSAGFLHARPAAQQLVEPLVVSWGWQAERPGPSAFQDWYEWAGTYEPAAALSVPDAIRYQAERGWDVVRADCHGLLAAARATLCELLGSAPICPDGPEWWGQMCSVELPAGAPIEQAALYERFGVELPLVSWGGRRFIRVSCQGYNTPEDMERLIAAVGALSGRAAGAQPC